MKSAPPDITQLALLARIRLSQSEQTNIEQQIDKALARAKPLLELDVSQVEPTIHINPPHDVFGEDTATNSLPIRQSLANAPQQANEQIRVPKIIADA